MTYENHVWRLTVRTTAEGKFSVYDKAHESFISGAYDDEGECEAELIALRGQLQCDSMLPPVITL